MRLSTADCICISGFWGLCPRPPPGLCPWTPLGDFRPPGSLCPPSKPWLRHGNWYDAINKSSADAEGPRDVAAEEFTFVVRSFIAFVVANMTDLSRQEYDSRRRLGDDDSGASQRYNVHFRVSVVE